MNENFQTVYENMPYSVRGITLYDACDDYYTIILNCRFSYNVMKKALLHELRHIYNDDIHSNKTVDEIELQAHQKE